MDSDSKRSSTVSGDSVNRFETQRCKVNNHREYSDFLHRMDESKPLYILFIGSKSPTSGYLWSPTCSEVLHLVEKQIAESYNSVFLLAQVGSQDEWEAETNPFKTDKQLQLKTVPTLLKYGTPKRLEGIYCLKPEFLDMLFEEECDE